MSDSPPSSGQSSGPATDRHNEPVVDPSANVLDLVDAAVRRLDDLRKLESNHLKDREDLRATYDEKLRLAESARIDAIRAVDVAAVQRASEVAGQQAAALAAQVSASAETLRTQVSAAASASSIALNAALDPIQTAIQDLRRVQYEGVGQKTQVVETRGANGNTGLWVGLGVSILFGLVASVAAIASLVP